MTSLSCQRDAFYLEDEVRYFNCAFLSPRLKSVEEAGIAGIRQRRAPHRIEPVDFFADSDRVREMFGALVNAPSERIALIPSVSYGIALVTSNVRASRGQNVVLSGEQFPSNVYGWRRLAEREGLDLRTVEPPPPGLGRGQRWNEALLAAIDEQTAAVSLGNVHWTDGTRFDLEEIGRRVRRFGGVLVVDGTQSVGALPFDVERLRPDALICTSYKSLLGPYSLGVAYLGPRFDDGEPLEQTWLGRRRSEDFSGLTDYDDEYRPGAGRFDMGERSSFVLVPMLIAALRQILEWQPERIQDYCARLTSELADEAAALGYFVEHPQWRAAHVFGLRPPAHVSIAALTDELRRRGVVVSVRGGAIRVSPHLHNDAADIAALLEALKAAS